MAVLIKGKSIKGTKDSRDHYLRGPENERITLREISGFATKDPDEALQMIELSAKGTQCAKPLYSAKVSPETDRLWTKEEIRRAIELLEENLGLKGQPRIVVEHKKHGRVHYHVLWSRFPPDGGAAVHMGHNYAINLKTQKQIEKEFKLRPMMARGRDFRQWEIEWAKRYGFDIFKLRKEITKDFNAVKSGQAFLALLEKKGCVLCRGDKSQFVLILPWSQHKALSSMIHGRPTKATLRRALADIDIKKLPTVDEGKARIKARLPERIKKPRVGKILKVGLTSLARGMAAAKPRKLSLPRIPFRRAATEATTPQPQSVPFLPSPHRKGWPPEAVRDWEAWGKKDPARFFTLWPECKPDGLWISDAPQR